MAKVIRITCEVVDTQNHIDDDVEPSMHLAHYLSLLSITQARFPQDMFKSTLAEFTAKSWNSIVLLGILD